MASQEYRRRRLARKAEQARLRNKPKVKISFEKKVPSKEIPGATSSLYTMQIRHPNKPSMRTTAPISYFKYPSKKDVAPFLAVKSSETKQGLYGSYSVPKYVPEEQIEAVRGQLSRRFPEATKVIQQVPRAGSTSKLHKVSHSLKSKAKKSMRLFGPAAAVATVGQWRDRFK